MTTLERNPVLDPRPSYSWMPLLNDERPILLLDIDGVTSPFSPSFEHEAYRLPAVPGLRKRKAYAHRDARLWFEILSEEYEIVWCTAWQHLAPACHGSALGVGSHRYVPLGAELRDGWFAVPGPIDAHNWKFHAVEAWIDNNAPGRRVAWIDDGINLSDALAWKDRDDRMVVPTDADEGMHMKHIHRLIGWARR